MTTNKGSTEVLKVMLHTDGAIEVEMRHGAGHPLDKHAKNWGMVLADVVRHISYAYQRTDGADPMHVRDKVMAYLQEDLDAVDPEHTMPVYRRLDHPGG